MPTWARFARWEREPVSPRSDPFPGFNFIVKIQKLAVAGFSEIVLPEQRARYLEYREAGSGKSQKILAGISYGPLILEPMRPVGKGLIRVSWSDLWKFSSEFAVNGRRHAIKVKQGHAIWGVELKIVDEQGRRLPHDGESAVEGLGVALDDGDRDAHIGHIHRNAAAHCASADHGDTVAGLDAATLEEMCASPTDTVGFIRDLPQDLFAAFKATLEELEDADLLLHLVREQEVEIHENSPLAGISLRELGGVRGIYRLVVTAIKRQEETLIPRGDDVIQAAAPRAMASFVRCDASSASTMPRPAPRPPVISTVPSADSSESASRAADSGCLRSAIETTTLPMCLALAM